MDNLDESSRDLRGGSKGPELMKSAEEVDL